MASPVSLGKDKRNLLQLRLIRWTNTQCSIHPPPPSPLHTYFFGFRFTQLGQGHGVGGGLAVEGRLN